MNTVTACSRRDLRCQCTPMLRVLRVSEGGGRAYQQHGGPGEVVDGPAVGVDAAGALPVQVKSSAAYSGQPRSVPNILVYLT